MSQNSSHPTDFSTTTLLTRTGEYVLIGYIGNQEVGSVTYTHALEEDSYYIGISHIDVDLPYRGRGYSTLMLTVLKENYPDLSPSDFETSYFEHPAAARVWSKVFGWDHSSLIGD